jgi:hypothetical protein
MPKRKVSVGLLSGSIVSLIFLGLQLFDPAVADKIPPAGAGELATVVGFIVAYLIPEADQAP